MDEKNTQPNTTQPPDAPVDEWQVKAEEYLNNWKRAEADLANYKKDEQRRIADILKFGNEATLMQAVSVMDNLERALLHTPPEVSGKNVEWLKGIDQTVKQFQELLTKYNVERIKTVGQKFNPLYHEAISGEGETVSQELQSGYILEGKVIRPARVVLSK